MAWVGVEDDELVIGTLPDQRKLDNLRRDPRVAISFESPHRNQWGLNEYLVVRGRARVTEGGAADLLHRLARGYPGPDPGFPALAHPAAGRGIRVAPGRGSG